MADEDVAPEDYTWTMAVKDLALTTPLTLMQAIAFLRPLECTGELSPHETLPRLVDLVNSLAEGNAGKAGQALDFLTRTEAGV